MDIDHDAAKNLANIAKHGAPLAFGGLILAAPAVVIISTARKQDGEDREKAIGLVGGRLWTAVFVRREHGIRFISVRRRNDAESRTYHRDPG